jgi:hypothetical protein
MQSIEEQVTNITPTPTPTPTPEVMKKPQKPKKTIPRINTSGLNLLPDIPVLTFDETDTDTTPINQVEAHDVATDPWTHILKCQNYDGTCEITVTSKQIKDCKATWKGEANQFEPRLLAYQTSADSRPDIFKQYGIYILPVQNGTYVLTKNKIYQELDYSQTPASSSTASSSTDSSQPIYLKRDTSSVLLSLGESETSFIDNLRYSGVFERPEFLNEPITHGSLLNGRHRCSFEMKLGGKSYSIKGVQYEVDSCFESANKILIIEGKNTNTEFDSFNIRQLYFPYREIIEKIKAKKEVICLFIHKCCEVVHIWKYIFTEPTQMDSISLAGHYTFKFE